MPPAASRGFNVAALVDTVGRAALSVMVAYGAEIHRRIRLVLHGLTEVEIGCQRMCVVPRHGLVTPVIHGIEAINVVPRIGASSSVLGVAGSNRLNAERLRLFNALQVATPRRCTDGPLCHPGQPASVRLNHLRRQLRSWLAPRAFATSTIA